MKKACKFDSARNQSDDIETLNESVRSHYRMMTYLQTRTQ